MSGFIIGMQSPYDDGRDMLRLQLTTDDTDTPDSVVVILDMDYFITRQEAVPVPAALDWIEIAQHASKMSSRLSHRSPAADLSSPDQELTPCYIRLCRDVLDWNRSALRLAAGRVGQAALRHQPVLPAHPSLVRRQEATSSFLAQQSEKLSQLQEIYGLRLEPSVGRFLHAHPDADRPSS